MINLLECLEKRIESRLACHLPWVARSGAAASVDGFGRNCSTQDEYDLFIKEYTSLFDFSRKEVYQAGCTYLCQYNVSTVYTFYGL